MNVRVELGGERRFTAQQAVVVYREHAGFGSDCFAVVHDVVGPATASVPASDFAKGARPAAAPRLGEGKLLTMDFLAQLGESIGARLEPEVLPEGIIAHTQHVVAWWTKPHMRPMWYREDSTMGHLSARHFPVPALLWKLVGRSLYVRALPSSSRPTAETVLCYAPFWNTNETALVCCGTMARPKSGKMEALQGWVDAYFAAEFTHDWGNRHLSKHPKGFVQMWAELGTTRTGRRKFPVKYLVPTKETVRDFLRRGGARA